MGLFSKEETQEEKTEQYFSDFLANNKNAVRSGGEARTLTVPVPSALNRINPFNLEAAYHTDEVIFNGINLYVSMFTSANYTIDADDDGKELCEKFLLKSDFDDVVLPRMVGDYHKYGYEWRERHFKGGNLVRMSSLDPKACDVRRNSEKIPLRNSDKSFKSYVCYLTPGLDAGKKTIIEQNDLWGIFSRAYELPTKNLARSVFYQVGDDPLGVGVIEPIYNLTMAKQTISQITIQAQQRIGTPLYGFKVGTPEMQPTPEIIARVHETTKDINERNSFAHAYWVEPHVIESSNKLQMEEQLEGYINRQVSALAAPKCLVTGVGEESNRSTLDKQIYIWEKRFNFINNRIAQTLNNNEFKILADQAGLDVVPKIIFDDMSTDSIFGKIERWSELAKAGLLLPDKSLRDHIRDIEGLPKETDDGVLEQKKKKNETTKD